MPRCWVRHLSLRAGGPISLAWNSACPRGEDRPSVRSSPGGPVRRVLLSPSGLALLRARRLRRSGRVDEGDEGSDELILRDVVEGPTLHDREQVVSPQCSHGDCGDRVLFGWLLSYRGLQGAPDGFPQLRHPVAFIQHESVQAVETADVAEHLLEFLRPSLEGVADGLQLGARLLHLCTAKLDLSFDRGPQQRFFRWEVAVKASRACGETDPAFDLGDRGPVELLVGEDIERGFKDALARLWLRRLVGHHDEGVSSVTRCPGAPSDFRPGLGRTRREGPWCHVP